MSTFRDELKEYEIGMGSIRFHSNKPLSSELVKKLVKARIAENLEFSKKIRQSCRRTTVSIIDCEYSILAIHIE